MKLSKCFKLEQICLIFDRLLKPLKAYVMTKKLLFTILASCLFIFSCNKSDSSSGNSNTVEYRITATNAGNMNMGYNDKDQNFIGGTCSSGWVMNFTTTKKPYTAFLKATPYNPINAGLPITLNLKILVNGNVVVTQDFSGMGSLIEEIQYVIQ